MKCKDGKPLRHALIIDISSGKEKGNERKFSGKYDIYKKTRHMKNDFPESSRNSVNNYYINSLIISMIKFDSIEVNDAQFLIKNAGMLGDTSAQGHVAPPSHYHMHVNFYGIIKIANGPISKTHNKDNCTMSDEVGNTHC